MKILVCNSNPYVRDCYEFSQAEKGEIIICFPFSFKGGFGTSSLKISNDFRLKEIDMTEDEYREHLLDFLSKKYNSVIDKVLEHFNNTLVAEEYVELYISAVKKLPEDTRIMCINGSFIKWTDYQSWREKNATMTSILASSYRSFN